MPARPSSFQRYALRPGMIMREIFPGRPIRAVIFAHGAPRPLAEIRSPSFPMLRATRTFFQSPSFSRRCGGYWFHRRESLSHGCSCHYQTSNESARPHRGTRPEKDILVSYRATSASAISEDDRGQPHGDVGAEDQAIAREPSFSLRRVAMDTDPCFDKRACQPWPYRPLMIGAVSFADPAVI